MIVSINPSYPQRRHIDRVTRLLLDGGLIALPTDTNFAFACLCTNRRGIDRIHRLKKEDRKKPLSLLCADFTQVSRYTLLSNSAYRIMNRLLPGPYTVILRANYKLPRILSEKRKKVGVRMPDSPLIQCILEQIEYPLTASTIPGKDEYDILSTAWAVAGRYENHVDLVIDGGFIPAQPSTILDLSEDEPLIVREGLGPVDML
jgi:tRNA threonylcarbamoyl adenosine modification protein (Sua5/YciO/YrdC/YwlC family)